MDAGGADLGAAGEHTAVIRGDLLASIHVTGNLVPDAQLAALAIRPCRSSIARAAGR